MPWSVILPLAASALQGAIAGGIESHQAARENRRQDLVARMRRKEMQPLIDRLRRARDYFGVEENFVRDFSRASDEMAAQSAQSGMTDAGRGGLDQVRSDALGAGLAELAQFKAQDDAQRQQLLAQILSDPNLFAGTGDTQNPGVAGLLGGLAGGTAGLGSALTSFISTQEGLDALGGLFGASGGGGGGGGPVQASMGPSLATGLGSWLTRQAGGQDVTPNALPNPTPSVSLRNPTGQQGGPPSPTGAPLYSPNRSNPYYSPGRR